MLTNLLQHIRFDSSNYTTVHGGDINQAFKVYKEEQPFFLKLNAAEAYPSMMLKEAHGLDALRKNSLFVIPSVEAVGEWEGKQYLVLEWLEPVAPTPDCWKRFGEALAHQHQQAQEAFGWEESNYIGKLVQSNEWHSTWNEFFITQRIKLLVEQLVHNRKLPADNLIKLDRLEKMMPGLFPDESPALLHGDLWSGNFSCTGHGHPAIFDPAIYAGHREMDIGLTQLFGGFDNAYLDAYNYYYPLEKNWKDRLPLTQLYPLLVHAVLFGGHYCAEVNNIFNHFWVI